jgi:hypothetical protein
LLPQALWFSAEGFHWMSHSKIRSYAYIAVALLLWLSEVSESQTAQTWGIGTGIETDEIADKVKELGVTWIRMTIYWNEVERAKGLFDWTVPDAQVDRAEKRQLKVYAVIHSTPSWANGNQKSDSPPHNARDWSDFVTAVAERYGTTRRALIRAYGMWNEPNVKKFWSGSREEYVQKILIPGFAAIKQVNPKLQVVGVEMSHHWIDQKEWNLRDIMKAAGSSMDVLGLHYYPDSDVSLSKYLDKHVVSNRNGKEVWITEIGKSACSDKKDSEPQQSKVYKTFVSALKERSEWFTRIFPYRIWDPQDGCEEEGNGFGLTYGSPITERLVFRTYREIILGN